MTFCYSPWSNVDISPQGDITPCCKFQSQYYDQKFNIKQHSLEQYINSDLVKSVKHEFEQGQWPAGCERCQVEEKNNIPSKRQLDWERWKDHYQLVDLEQPEFLTASVAFGNTCNLSCITCNPYSSSQWRQEYQTVYGTDIVPFHFYKDQFVDDFLTQAPNLIHLDIPGGEPFLSGVREQKQLLQHYIDQGVSNRVALHYTTNATVYPDGKWWELWQHFKEVDIQLSIDGVAHRYEYVRNPAKWDTLVQHVQQYLTKTQQCSNIKLSVSHTVSAYNIFYLDEFLTWNYNIGLPRPWIGRVHNPAHMRFSVWSGTAKNIIVDCLQNSSHDDARTWGEFLLNTDDSDQFELFQQRLKEHDSYRGTDFKRTFPELAEYV
jgi:hypothetical protein